MGEPVAPPDHSIPLTGWPLIPLRLMAMVALLVVCALLYYLWRLLRLKRFWPRVFLAGMGILSGMRVEIIGRHHKDALLLSNHVSWLDILAIARATGTAFVAHDGLKAIRPLKHLCDMNDTVFVARHDRGSVAEQVEQVRFAIEDTGALTIFPEGTTDDGTYLLPFKSSLLSAIDPLPEGLYVQPLYLEYADSQSLAWIGDEHGARNFFRIIARWRPVRLRLHLLPVLEGEALANRKTIAAAAQEAIEGAMAVARA
jgi:1-acyl-sn-glycerol-3-phosphate acyltransferase